MSLPVRLVAARQAHKLSQAQLAKLTGIHPTQIKRYEAGTAEPSCEALRKLSIALAISTDTLLFEENERGPAGDDLKLLFEAVDHFAAEDKVMAKRILQGLILQNQAQFLAKAS